MPLLIDDWDLPTKQARFGRIAEEMARERHVQGSAGFGTLQEKRLHAALKRYLCEDTDYHEVGFANSRYVADVRVDDEIYEVQTGSFYPMKKKIEYYLSQTECTVTVVHPLAVERTLCWINPETGDVSKPRKVGYRSREIELLPELYPFLSLLGNDRLRFRLLLLSVQDFRLLNGWSADRKKGSGRYERVPLKLLDDRLFSSPEDYREFLPEGMVSPFKVSDFSKAARLRGRDSYSAVRVLEALGLVCKSEPIGRAMAFSVC